MTEQIEDAKAFNPALKLAGVLITSYQNTDGEAAGVELSLIHIFYRPKGSRRVDVLSSISGRK